MKNIKTLYFPILLLLLFPITVHTQEELKQNIANPQNTTEKIPFQQNLLKCSKLINKQEFQAASLILKEIYPKITNKERKSYYKILTEKLSQKNLSKTAFLWSCLKEKTANDLLIFLKNDKATSLVLSNKTELNNKFREYLKNSEEFLTEINFKNDYSVIPDLISPLYIVDLIDIPEINSFSITISENDKQKNPQYFTLFLYNIYQKFFNTQIKKTGNIVFKQKNVKKITLEAGLFFHIMNRISLYFGNVFIEPEEDTNIIETIEENFAQSFPIIEEIRSNTATVYSSSIFVEKKFISKAQEESIYFYYLTFLLNRLKVKPESSNNIPYLIQFNKLIKKNAIVFNINNVKMEINFKAMKEVVKALHKEVFQAEKTADFEKLSSIQNSFSDIPEQLKKINLAFKNTDHEKK